MRLATFLFVFAMFAASCGTEPEPDVIPPQPQFADSTQAPNPIEHRIYADVDPTLDAIWIEWKADSTHNTTGYLLYRSQDSIVGDDGLLHDSLLVAKYESSNVLLNPLPTRHRDTVGIAPGGTFYYQLRALYRAPTDRVTYSKPTVVDNTTSFHYSSRVKLLSPDGMTPLPVGGQVKFRWDDPNNGGLFNIIVERTDQQEFVWSPLLQSFSSSPTFEYPLTSPALLPGAHYRWRVKRVAAFGGSSSPWMSFTVQP